MAVTYKGLQPPKSRRQQIDEKAKAKKKRALAGAQAPKKKYSKKRILKGAQAVKKKR